MKGVTPMVTAITTAASKGDMAGARAAAKTMDDGWKVFAASFPAGSDSAAGKTRAKPEIWSDAAGFKAELDKAQASSAAILAATNGTDADAVVGTKTAAMNVLDMQTVGAWIHNGVAVAGDGMVYLSSDMRAALYAFSPRR